MGKFRGKAVHVPQVVRQQRHAFQSFPYISNKVLASPPQRFEHPYVIDSDTDRYDHRRLIVCSSKNQSFYSTTNSVVEWASNHLEALSVLSLVTEKLEPKIMLLYNPQKPTSSTKYPDASLMGLPDEMKTMIAKKLFETTSLKEARNNAGSLALTCTRMMDLCVEVAKKVMQKRLGTWQNKRVFWVQEQTPYEALPSEWVLDEGDEKTSYEEHYDCVTSNNPWHGNPRTLAPRTPAEWFSGIQCTNGTHAGYTYERPDVQFHAYHPGHPAKMYYPRETKLLDVEGPSNDRLFRENPLLARRWDWILSPQAYRPPGIKWIARATDPVTNTKQMFNLSGFVADERVSIMEGVEVLGPGEVLLSMLGFSMGEHDELQEHRNKIASEESVQNTQTAGQWAGFRIEVVSQETHEKDLVNGGSWEDITEDARFEFRYHALELERREMLYYGGYEHAA